MCLIALLAMISPRLAFFLVWVFGDRVQIAFDGWLLPLLGLFFLPWTALVYVLAYAPVRGVSGFGWFCVGIAFMADIASLGSGERERRTRVA